MEPLAERTSGSTHAPGLAAHSTGAGKLAVGVGHGQGRDPVTVMIEALQGIGLGCEISKVQLLGIKGPIHPTFQH